MKQARENKWIRLSATLLLAGSLAFFTGCGGGGDEEGGTTPPSTGPVPTTLLTTKSFDPQIEKRTVTLSSATFEADAQKDSPITKAAVVSMKDGTISITEGKGVRAYEIKLLFNGDDFRNVTFKDGGYIAKDPSPGEGILASLEWNGTASPHLIEAILTDAEGRNIPAVLQ